MEKNLCVVLLLSTSYLKFAFCTDNPVSTGFRNYGDYRSPSSSDNYSRSIELANQRCMTAKERDSLECGTYVEKGIVKTSSPKDRDRWNSLHCSTVDRDVVSQLMQVSKEPIYYLSTREGFSSHMLQYNTIWNWARARERSVITFDYISLKHYGNVSVSVCDVFVLPKTFKCLKGDQRERLTSDFNCIIVGKPGGWNTVPRFYDMNDSALICSDVNIRNIQCVAGFIPILDKSNVIYPPIDHNLYGNYTFSKYYNKLFTRITGILRVQEKNTIVFHWRRGDQYTRCEKGTDRGVNCKSVHEFIKTVNSSSTKFNLSKFTKYLSTNENDTSIIGKFLALIIF